MFFGHAPRVPPDLPLNLIHDCQVALMSPLPGFTCRFEINSNSFLITFQDCGFLHQRMITDDVS